MPGSRLDDVDNEDGGPVRPGVGLHHAAGEGGDPGEPLREGNLLLFHSTFRPQSFKQIHSVFGKM